MDDKAKDGFNSILKRLELSQALVEQDVFNTLNQQDMIYKMFTESIEKFIEFMSYMEAYEFQALKLSEDLVNIKHLNNNIFNTSEVLSELDIFFKSVIEKQRTLQEICLTMQNLLEFENETSDAVHKLEGSIAVHRNSIDNLINYYKNNI